MKCRACSNDAGPNGRPLPDVHRPAKMWWDREPGYVRDEIAREIAYANRPAITYAPEPYGTPICAMTPRQLVAELTRQSKRLANAVLGEYRDYTGPRAAEEYVTARRAELGLDLEAAA